MAILSEPRDDYLDEFDAKTKKKALQYERKALKVIKKAREEKQAGPYNIQELAVFMGISRQTIYNHNLHFSQKVYDALQEHRLNEKLQIMQKMKDSNDPRLIEKQFRLFADSDELQRLNTRHEIRGTGQNGEIQVNSNNRLEVILGKIPDEILDKLIVACAEAFNEEEEENE